MKPKSLLVAGATFLFSACQHELTWPLSPRVTDAQEANISVSSFSEHENGANIDVQIEPSGRDFTLGHAQIIQGTLDAAGAYRARVSAYHAADNVLNDAVWFYGSNAPDIALLKMDGTDVAWQIVNHNGVRDSASVHQLNIMAEKTYIATAAGSNPFTGGGGVLSAPARFPVGSEFKQGADTTYRLK